MAQIFPLSEGSFTIDKTKLFVPFNQGSDNLQERPVGSLLVEIQPFAIRTKNDVLLIDAGLGFEINGELQIFQNLKKVGIQPEEVTKILMSHLHKDHAGGLRSLKMNNGKYEQSFPNAEIFIQEAELEYAFQVGFPSFITEELECLRNARNVTLVRGNGIIGNNIYYELVGGHSPYHQVFRIEEDGETIFFGGDNAPQVQQMKNKFIAKYDHDGRTAMELRQGWWEKGQQNNWTFLFYHDIKIPIYNP